MSTAALSGEDSRRTPSAAPAGGLMASMKAMLFSSKSASSTSSHQAPSSSSSSADDDEDRPAHDDEEIFSNPSSDPDADRALDAEEGEGYFSDGTGATSATSDGGPGSPGSATSSSHAYGMGFLGLHGLAATPALRTADPAFDAAQLKLSPLSGSGSGNANDANQQQQQKQQLFPLLEQGELPSLSSSEATQPSFTRNETIRGPSSVTHRTGPARQATLVAVPQNRNSHRSRGPSPSQSPALRSSALPHLPTDAAAAALPSANDLPNDPELAESLSRGLFVKQPTTMPMPPVSATASPSLSPVAIPAHQSPLATIITLPGTETISPKLTSATSSPSPSPGLAARRLNRLGAAALPPVPLQQGQVRSTARSSSPVALTFPLGVASSESLALSGGGGEAVPLSAGSNASFNAAAAAGVSPAIFERDIEHRDASHLLSATEAMDVAIPTVLTDAVEALHAFDPEELEIVEPAVPVGGAAPPALSTTALTDHDTTAELVALQQQAQIQTQEGSGVTSLGEAITAAVANSPHSPPLSYASDREMQQQQQQSNNNPPLGTLAAQIAQKFAASPARSAGSVMSSAMSPSFAASASATPAAATAGAPSRGRTTAAAASPTRTAFSGSSSPLSRRDYGLPSFGGSPARGASPDFYQAGAAAAASSTSAGGASAAAAAAGAMAFPSLPLPNPYRSPSPIPAGAAALDSTQPIEATGGEAPAATSSISVDGAVMSGAEIATAQASLDGLADAVISSGATTPLLGLGTGPGPVAFPSVESAPYAGLARGDRRTISQQMQQTSTLPAHVLDAQRKVRNSAALSTSSLSQSSSAANGHTAGASRRLSFFSAADMINSAKGEVHTFQEALQSSADVENQQHGLGLGLAAAGGASFPATPSTAAAMGRSLSGPQPRS